MPLTTGIRICFCNGFPTVKAITLALNHKKIAFNRAELLALLSQRDRQGVWTVADHLASGDWWDNHILGYEALTALEWQEHLSSRLKLVASLAECLLGPRALEFFRFRSAACLGQKSLYPFAIVLRQLSAELRAAVLERAQHRLPRTFRGLSKRYCSGSRGGRCLESDCREKLQARGKRSK